jgi:hypothetical protein
VTSSLIPLLTTLHLIDDELQHEVGSLLLLLPDEIEQRVSNCLRLITQCESVISLMSQPLSLTDSETLQAALIHLRRTVKIYQSVLRSAQRSCCATFASRDIGSVQLEWKG